MTQTQAQLRQGFMTPDGKVFDTKAEAMDYLRKPQKEAALNKLNGNNAELTDWLLENEEAIDSTFESTKIRRVSKSEKKQLEKALEAVEKAGDKAFAFLIDNKEAIADSFRWPSVKRGTEEEQAATIRAGFMALTGDNAELVDWIVENKAGILEAYQAGVVKREVNPKAQNALAEYRAKRAAEKAAKEQAAG
jgi:hypothetical protein